MVWIGFGIKLYVSGYKNRFQNFIRYLREIGDEVNSRGSDSVEVNDCSRGDYPPLVVDLSDNSTSDCAAVEEIRVPTRRSLRNQEVFGTLISDRIDKTANNTGKNMPWKRRRNPILEETAVTEGASFFEEPPTWSKHNAETTDFEEAKAQNGEFSGDSSYQLCEVVE
ncbi:Sulfoquinovosyl transferase SQD2 [Camellia lanceoleosa]|uniref:Sulfoquinovosyl transferase SQD2 n=1 Tax=Camellia lanceoleosa TaxID=1840588 RepID=A0ACC0FIQ0_9ERIC|nr:Sulfoquinovosyl transferase SQD2 [Camellia lanceoleosa]